MTAAPVWGYECENRMKLLRLGSGSPAAEGLCAGDLLRTGSKKKLGKKWRKQDSEGGESNQELDFLWSSSLSLTL